VINLKWKRIACVIRELAEMLYLVDRAAQGLVDRARENQMLAEGPYQSVMRLVTVLRLRDPRCQQGRLRDVIHGIVGAVACAFGIATSKSSRAADKRARPSDCMIRDPRGASEPQPVTLNAEDQPGVAKCFRPIDFVGP
jgi:hypothetical protein